MNKQLHVHKNYDVKKTMSFADSVLEVKRKTHFLKVNRTDRLFYYHWSHTKKLEESKEGYVYKEDID